MTPVRDRLGIVRWIGPRPVDEPPASSVTDRPGLQPCGTVAAYSRHRRAGERPCDACREAENAGHRERRAKQRASEVAPPKASLAPCGTTAAYSRHRRAGEPACDACREAKRTHEREARRRARAAQKIGA